MNQVKLSIHLYNDYSNVSLGNSSSQANHFSRILTEYAFEYLIRATGSDFFEDVYYDAIDFFRAKNMEEHVYQLQRKMYVTIRSKCDFRDLVECGLHFSISAINAWRRQSHHLTIWSGMAYISIWDKLNLTLSILVRVTIILVTTLMHRFG